MDELPGGYWGPNRQLHRAFELAALNGRDEEDLAAAIGSVPTLVTEVLSRCVRRIGEISPVHPRSRGNCSSPIGITCCFDCARRPSVTGYGRTCSVRGRIAVSMRPSTSRSRTCRSNNRGFRAPLHTITLTASEDDGLADRRHLPAAQRR